MVTKARLERLLKRVSTRYAKTGASMYAIEKNVFKKLLRFYK